MPGEGKVVHLNGALAFERLLYIVRLDSFLLNVFVRFVVSN